MDRGPLLADFCLSPPAAMDRKRPLTNDCYWPILLKKSVRPNSLNIGR